MLKSTFTRGQWKAIGLGAASYVAGIAIGSRLGGFEGAAIGGFIGTFAGTGAGFYLWG